MSSKRISPITICIFCEGSNTEPNYFERIVEQIKDSNFWFEVLIYDSEKSNPFSLVNEAVFLLDEFDEVWAVFDKDHHPKLKEVFEDNQYKKIIKAFSSISFEHWILLHFEKSSFSFPKSNDVEERLRTKKYLPTYCKRNDYDLYTLIGDYTDIAIENSAWLRREKLEDLKNEHNRIYMINPYTNVDKLVSKLLNYRFKIFWFKHNDNIKFNKLNFNIINLNINTNHTILKLLIQNNKRIAHPINCKSVIYIRESSRINNRINFSAITTALIIPGANSNITITFPKLDNTKSYNLIIEDNDVKIIIELEI